MKAIRSKNPSRRLYAEKSKIVARLKRLRIMIYDRKENGTLDYSFLDEYRHKVNKFVEVYEKDNLPWGVKLTRRQALYWREKIRKTCIDVKDNIVENQKGDIKKSQKLRVESNYCTMDLSKHDGEVIDNDGDEPSVKDKDEDGDEVMSSSSQSVSDSDEENMSDSESQYEYVYADPEDMSETESQMNDDMCPVFNGEKENFDGFLHNMDYMVYMIWKGENLLDRFTAKTSYDYLMRHLSPSQILIAKMMNATILRLSVN